MEEMRCIGNYIANVKYNIFFISQNIKLKIRIKCYLLYYILAKYTRISPYSPSYLFASVHTYESIARNDSKTTRS